MRHLFWCVTLAALALGAPRWGVAGETEDKDTAQRVAKALRDSGRVKDYHIGVKCKDGSVWLAGSVLSDKQMQAALEVASETQGVQRIINNLEVKRAAKGAAKPASVPAASGLVSQASAQAALPPAVVAPAAATTAAVAQTPAGQAAAAPAAHKKAKRNVAVYRGVPTGYQEVQPAEPVGPAQAMPAPGRPLPMYGGGNQGVYPAGAYGMGVQGGAYGPGGAPQAAYDTPSMPNYAWPSYAAYPNYAAVTYPKQYSASAWPFIGPFHPYPQVPMGWRKVTLEWDDGWWFLDFEDRSYQ